MNTPPARRASRGDWMRLGVLATTIVALATVAVLWGATELRATIASIGDGGVVAIGGFVVLYAVATVMLVPGSASTVTAGLVFGAPLGAAVAITGATLGAVGAFLAARSLGRAPFRQVENQRAEQLERWMTERQFRSIVVLRLLPVVPFNLFNYTAGLLPVTFANYLTGTIVGIAPGTIVVAAVGSNAHHPTGAPFLIALTVLAILIAGSSLFARRRNHT